MAAHGRVTPATLVRALRRLTPAEILAIAPAWCLVGVAAAAIRAVPFARIAPVLGHPLGDVALCPLLTPRQLRRARLVSRAIACAARVAPFRADCLPQALAAAVACRWLDVPTATHLGVSLRDAERNAALNAHAWILAGPIAVTGGRGVSAFRVVACFSTLRR